MRLLEGKTLLVTGGSRRHRPRHRHRRRRATAPTSPSIMSATTCRPKAASRRSRRRGARAFAVKGDVAEPATATAFVSRAAEALGRVDVFVSNAGICPFHAFLDMPAETFERVMKVNLHGAYYMVQAAANQMVAQGDGGAIVAVSSISALVGGEYQTHYTPTKAGVHSLMQSAAIALGKHGIRCNSVLPGTILTDINKDDLADPAKREYMEGRVPLGRLGQPDDVAGPILFLASDLARYVTGAALLVDGGAFVNLQ